MATPLPCSRELDLKTPRFVQHVQHTAELGLIEHADLSYHNVIYQLQTGAVRYQVYSVVDSLPLYLTHYAPNVHGYPAAPYHNSIEKSCTKRIMWYWEWERMTGKFTNDYDPITYDNIMVTDYLGVAIGLYASATERKAHWIFRSQSNSTSAGVSVTWLTHCSRPFPPTTTADTPVTKLDLQPLQSHRYDRTDYLLAPPRETLRREDQTPLRARPGRRDD